jgi:phenylalanyl-tRNA synthetase beta subunit
MKIPINWLAEYVDLTGLSDAQISNGLTMSGTENEIVKGVEFAGIVVGEIKEITDHPDADRLHVAQVDIGGACHSGLDPESIPKIDSRLRGNDECLLQIVCGAPNIEVGQKVPVALIGAMIGEFEIKKAKIRGVESNGMLCSESELGISDNHDGILILDPRAKVGSPLGEALNIGGTVLEAEITPNRSDCFSMIGVGNEAAASLNRKMKSRNFDKAEIKSKKKIDVKVAEKKLCPRYMTKVVGGIKIGPSPKWMQERLESCGVRPISHIVDVTNYVMLEWGQPMHAFDAKKIVGSISVRKAKKGEKLVTLDGVERTLLESDLVIADDKKAIALAGVMGGLNSEVDAKTTEIVLEAAVFDGTSVRKTAQRLGLRTEASNRFEKGIPLGLPELAIERAAGIIVNIPGGLAGKMPVVKPIAGPNTDVLSSWIWVQHIGLPFKRVQNFLGAAIEKPKVLEILNSLNVTSEAFDFKKEARKHIGKPYVWGASFRTHGDMAFDCSYLTDYIYSQIGQFVGHTCLAQYEIGTPVEGDLLPGDILFVTGHIEKSATDHYFRPDGKGGSEKVVLDAPKEVGHNALYIGDGRIVHCREMIWDDKKQTWKKLPKGEVVEESVTIFTENPQYLGARRFVSDPFEWIASTAPWWRLDIRIEEDILEEVGRIYGYINIPGELPQGKLPVYEPNTTLELSGVLKGIMIGGGFNEVLNYSFVSAKNLEDLGFESKKALRVANPISPEQEYMRTSLIPSLLKDISVNQYNFDDVRVFEIASIYTPVGEELPAEEPTLGIGIRVGSKDKSQNYFELKGAVESILTKLGAPALTAKDSLTAWGQKIEFAIGKNKLGEVLIPSAKVRQSFGIKTEVAVGEFSLNALSEVSAKGITYVPVSRYQQVIRDINMIFKKEVVAQDVTDAIAKVNAPELKKAYILDIYEGSGLPADEKSITIRMVISASDRTLTDDEIGRVQNQLVSYLTKSLAGKLRQ